MFSLDEATSQLTSFLLQSLCGVDECPIGAEPSWNWGEVEGSTEDWESTLKFKTSLLENGATAERHHPRQNKVGGQVGGGKKINKT